MPTLKSMTGFGKREGASRGLAIVAEVRSVNHRFREIVVRLPKGWLEREEELKALAARHCRRGRIEVTVTYARGHDAGALLTVDLPTARHYHRQLQQLQKTCGVGGRIDIGLLASFREIFRAVELPLDDQRVHQTVRRLVAGALTDLDRMRSTEGKALHADIAKRLKDIRAVHRSIHRRLPQLVKRLQERMRARVRESGGSSNGDNTRLNHEAALMAERCDVTEELTRLKSHLAQFDGMIKQREPVGRQLDFLLQEMGREVNTIGSKVNDVSLTQDVIRLKSELEKIREQVQNVE